MTKKIKKKPRPVLDDGDDDNPLGVKFNPRHEVSIAFFESKLRIDPGNIDREIIEHSERYFEVAEQAARASSRATAAKDVFAREEAELYRAIAMEKAEAGERVTEKALANEILCHPRRITAFEALQDAYRESATWDALRTAWSSRGYMLRDLAQLVLAGHTATRAVSSPERDAKANQGKSELARRRRTDWKKDL